MEIIEVLTPLATALISALIGVGSYSTLTNYRLDKLDKQVEALSALKDRIADLETRVAVIEQNVLK